MGKARIMCILWQLRKCRIGYFCAHWRNINLQKFFPLITFCIISIWYIKFIYNKLENKSLYMKLITFSEDPEDKFILTEYFNSVWYHYYKKKKEFIEHLLSECLSLCGCISTHRYYAWGEFRKHLLVHWKHFTSGSGAVLTMSYCFVIYFFNSENKCFHYWDKCTN